MHKITDAINDDEPYIRGVVDGVANRMMALRISGSAMALKWLKCKCWGSRSRGSPAKCKMRCMTS